MFVLLRIFVLPGINLIRLLRNTPLLQWTRQQTNGLIVVLVGQITGRPLHLADAPTRPTVVFLGQIINHR